MGRLSLTLASAASVNAPCDSGATWLSDMPLKRFVHRVRGDVLQVGVEARSCRPRWRQSSRSACRDRTLPRRLPVAVVAGAATAEGAEAAAGAGAVWAASGAAIKGDGCGDNDRLHGDSLFRKVAAGANHRKTDDTPISGENEMHPRYGRISVQLSLPSPAMVRSTSALSASATVTLRDDRRGGAGGRVSGAGADLGDGGAFGTGNLSSAMSGGRAIKSARSPRPWPASRLLRLRHGATIAAASPALAALRALASASCASASARSLEASSNWPRIGGNTAVEHARDHLWHFLPDHDRDDDQHRQRDEHRRGEPMNAIRDAARWPR